MRSLLLTALLPVVPAAVMLAAEPAGALKVGNALEATALTAAEQQKLFTLPAGFSIELVASEETGLPKPVSIAFDDAGRLWSQTATEYPRDKSPRRRTSPPNNPNA